MNHKNWTQNYIRYQFETEQEYQTGLRDWNDGDPINVNMTEWY